MVHSKGCSNTFENNELLGESFSIEWEPEAFYQIAKNGNETLKRFLDKCKKMNRWFYLPLHTSILWTKNLQAGILIVEWDIHFAIK